MTMPDVVLAAEDGGAVVEPAATGFSVELKNVTVKFGALAAMQNVSCSVESGGAVGIIGPNGAGKTTFLNAVSRLVRVESGQILVNDADILSLRANQVAELGVGRTFQLAEHCGLMTVAEFMLLGLHFRTRYRLLSCGLGTRGARREEFAARMTISRGLEEFGLDGISQTEKLDALPYGIRKRLDVARASLSSPRLLLLDEPTSGLGEQEANDIADGVQAVIDRGGCTVVVVDHRVGFIQRLCKSLVVLNFGEVISTGPAAEVLSHVHVREAYFGKADI